MSKRFAPFHDWMVRHDESYLFVALYIGLAVVLSVWISIFWLVVVVGAHVALELVRQRFIHRSRKRVLAEVAWELKLDVALILFALTLAVYMEVILGVLGLQSAARSATALKAGARAGGKAVAWERVLRGILLSLDDLAQVVRSVVGRKRSDKSEDTESPATQTSQETASSWKQAWGWGDHIALGLGVLCLGLLALSPLLTELDASGVAQRLAAELHPFPE